MRARARLVVGGVAAGAISVAALLSVSVASAVARVDSAGQPLAGSAVSVQTDGPVTPGSASAAGVVTVPAPQPAAVVAGGVPRTLVGSAEDALMDAVLTSGTWDAVRVWAAARGWPEERVDAWIERLEVKLERIIARGGSELPGNPVWNRPQQPNGESGTANQNGSTNGNPSGNRSSSENGNPSGNGNSSENGTGPGSSNGNGSSGSSNENGTAGNSSENGTGPGSSNGNPTPGSGSDQGNRPSQTPAKAGTESDTESSQPGGGSKNGQSQESPDR